MAPHWAEIMRLLTSVSASMTTTDAKAVRHTPILNTVLMVLLIGKLSVITFPITLWFIMCSNDNKNCY